MDRNLHSSLTLRHFTDALDFSMTLKFIIPVQQDLIDDVSPFIAPTSWMDWLLTNPVSSGALKGIPVEGEKIGYEI